MAERPDVERAFLEVGAYLASAASLFHTDPPRYANLRLLEGVHRVLTTLDRLGYADDELVAMAGELGEAMTGPAGKVEDPTAVADRLVAVLAARLEALEPVDD